MEGIKRIDWGLIPYKDAYYKQKELFETAIREKEEGRKACNSIIFCEHPHVITIGKNGLSSNLLFPEETLKEKQVELYHVDRGGDITYHGQGQSVVYPILDLESLRISLKAYIHLIEEAVIQLLLQYSIKAERLAGATGVWIDSEIPGKARKICAIGVRSSRYVTMHGLALNVNTNLDYFHLINPCGFIDKGVTSMEKELNTQLDMQSLNNRLFAIFSNLFC